MASKKQKDQTQGIPSRARGQDQVEESEVPAHAPISAVAPPAMQQQQNSPINSSQQFMIEFMQQMRSQQEDFMMQMAMRHEQMSAEMMQQHQRLVSGQSTPAKEQTLRNEDTPADLIINVDSNNIRNINRRDSAVHRLTTFNGATNREGMLTVESDKHASIIWENKTVDGFLKFLEEIDKFTLTYNQPVP
jgi:hypothetical protein